MMSVFIGVRNGVITRLGRGKFKEEPMESNQLQVPWLALLQVDIPQKQQRIGNALIAPLRTRHSGNVLDLD